MPLQLDAWMISIKITSFLKSTTIKYSDFYVTAHFIISFRIAKNFELFWLFIDMNISYVNSEVQAGWKIWYFVQLVHPNFDLELFCHNHLSAV